MNKHKVNRYNHRERDAFLPGWEEFMKLSRGIMEEEAEQLDSDPIEDEETELLAEPPPSYQAIPGGLEEKKTKKPDCIPGNAMHDSRGRFSTKANAKSWSKTHPDGAANDPTCKHGQRKSKGRWTRVRCGRELDADGKPSRSGTKADFRCYDGKRVRGKKKTNEELARQALSKLSRSEGSALVTEVVRQVLSSQSELLSEGVSRDELQTSCKQAGFYSLEFFLQLQDQMKRSQEGKLSGEQ